MINQVITDILVPAIILLLSFLFVQDWWRHRHFPPGPYGVPLLGFMPFMGERPFETFAKLRSKYGGLMGLKLGIQHVVVLNDWKTVREVLVDQGDLFAKRPPVFTWDYVIKKKDIVTNDGPVWKEQRKFMLKNMKDFGFGVKSSEDLILSSIHMVIDEIRTDCPDGKPISFKYMFFIPIMNVVWYHCAGHNLNKKDASARAMADLVRTLEKGFAVSDNPINFLPALRFLVPGAFGYWKFHKLFLSFVDILKEELRVHEMTYVSGRRRDFIDVYLEEIENQKAAGNGARPPFDDEHLLGTVFDVFLGGIDTTNSTMLWGFLLAAMHPSVQSKLQKELDTVVGRSRLPSIADSPKLPYLEAFTMEVNRFASIVPLSVPHTPIRDAKVRGYTIPAGTTVFQNIHGIHHDPEVWGDPMVFRPERFLDENNIIVKPPAYMTFSMGPRSCPGEPMAKMELYLFYSCLMHTFTFRVPPGEHPDLTPEMALTLSPQPYSLICTARNN